MRLLVWKLVLVVALSALIVWRRKRCIKLNKMGNKSEQRIEKIKEDSKKMLDVLYQKIVYTSESVIPLYDAIEDYFFQDLDYQKVKPCIPDWMINAGQSPEYGGNKVLYEKLRSVYNDPISNRIIHWADVQGLLTAFQDRVISIRNYLKLIYKYLPTYCLYEDSEYEMTTRKLDEISDEVHTAINNVFVSLCSSFDLFTKVVYECSKYDLNCFTEYKKLKCRKNNILYKKGNYGFDELKTEGLLYSEPACVRTACSFRDEFIHNSTWDYRCAIYYPCVKGRGPVEPFVVMPDVDATGNLVKSGSRNKFYSNSSKINAFLPGFIDDMMELLNKTVKTLIELLRKKTATGNKDKATDKAILTLLRNMTVLKNGK